MLERSRATSLISDSRIHLAPGSRACSVLLGLWLLAIALTFLNGCEKPSWSGAMPAVISVNGSVQGGQHTISGSSIQIYSAGTSGNSSPAKALLNEPVRSDKNGVFSFTAVCPSPSAQLYVVAREGNPGPNSGNNNPAIALMALVGTCTDTVSSSTVTVNEVTTIGSIWPLAPYMSSPTLLGSSAGDASFSSAVTLARQLADMAHGVSPGKGVPDGYVVQTAKLDSLADVLNACVNSYGGTAGDGSSCGLLFSLGSLRGSTPPTDTINAALAIAQAPDEDATNVFSLIPQQAAFRPTILSAPPDWRLPLLPVPQAPVIEPSAGTYWAGQQVTLTDAVPDVAIHYTTDGNAPSADSATYTSPFTLSGNETIRAIAIEEEISSPISSASYTVNPGRLIFSTQPENAQVGSPLTPAPAVSVVDSNGNRITGEANTITLTLNSGVPLSGSTTITPVQGVAVFSNLTIPAAGTGLTLSATTPGLASAKSASFNVSLPGMSLSLPASSIGIGSTVTGNINLGAPAGSRGTSIMLSSSSPQAVSVSPSALSIPAGQSTTKFTLNGVGAGSSVIKATAAGYSAASAQVSVDALSAANTAHLVFSTQPSNFVAGSILNPAPAVSAIDSNGNLVTGASNPIMLSLNGNSNAAINGPTTVTPVNGVAIFPNLSIPNAGNGYTLAATSAGMTSATSASFNVNAPALSFSLPATVVNVGANLTGTITLATPAGAGGVSVTLASSAPSDVMVSPSVLTIAAGHTSGTFTLSGIAAGSSILSASASGYSAASAQVTVVTATQPVSGGGSVTTVESLGAIPASQAVNGLGFNITAGNNWEFQMAAAAGATHARYQCSWVSTENQTPPPGNGAASPQFTLQPDCQAALASAAAVGMHSTIVAAYGSPYHQILTVTVPNGAPAGATTLNVQFATGSGGDTLATMAPFYDTIISSSNLPITNKHSYAGGLITGISLQDATHATLTLASGLSAALPPGTSTQYVVNEYLHPPPQSFSPTDPSVLAYARYAGFLASKISASGVTGEVEIWNEPPWSDDPWDDRYDFYDNQPVPVSPGPQTTYLPNWGFAAAIQAQASPAAGVTYNWGGTEKTGGNSLLNPQMLANTGVVYQQPNTIVTTESFHPYGNNPEDELWIEPCLAATISIHAAAAGNFASCNLAGVGPNLAYAVQLSLIEKAINPSWGIGHNITETGFEGAMGDNLHKARFVMRQFLGYQAAGVTPIEFYRLYDTSTDDFSFVNPTANADGTHSPLPAYTAVAGLMSDLGKIKLAPVAPYTASTLPTVAGYKGTYPLDTVSLVGARSGDTANSILFAVWQRSNTSGTWATLSSPAAAPVTLTIPAGLSVAAVLNLDTRAEVSYTSAGQQITFSVSDDPVEVLVEPAN